MPRKPTFDREQVIQAALRIAKNEGLSALTVRRVANELRASVAPIYAHFETFDDLLQAVVGEILSISQSLYHSQTGPDPFSNIGLASLQFAREYPRIFEELVLTRNEYLPDAEELDEGLIQAMGRDESMRDWSREERRRLLFKMKAMHLGMAALWATEQAPKWLDKDGAETLLMEVGKELLWAAQARRKGSLT